MGCIPTVDFGAEPRPPAMKNGSLFQTGMPPMQKLGVAALESGANRVLKSRKTLCVWNKSERVLSKRKRL